MRKSVVALFTALCLAAYPAYADRGHHRGGHHRQHQHHHNQGGGSAWVGLAVIGAIAGLALMAEQSRPRPAAAYQAQPVYPAPAPAEGTWYYCQSSGIYYPQTTACPEGWQAVPATPY
jgi:hypothetical protein